MDAIARNEDAFFTALKKMAIEIKKRDDFAVIFHHDADGVTSGSIAINALEREGKKVKQMCLKQLYKENIEEIRSLGKNYLFVDFGSGQLDYLKEEFSEETVFILDHHQPVKIEDKMPELKWHINPLLYGVDGGKELSGSGTTFFFAMALNKNNADLAPLALVGAVGDMQDFTGALIGLNRKIIAIAEQQKLFSQKNDLHLYGRISRPLLSYLMFSSNPILPELTANENNCRMFLAENNVPTKDSHNNFLSYEDLSEDDKKKLSSALITHMALHDVPEWKINSLIGEVYTLEREQKKSPLRDAKEFATAMNACGRHKQSETALHVCLGDRDIFGEYGKALALMQEHRTALRKGIEFVLANGIEDKEQFYFFDSKNEIEDSLVGIIAGMLYGSAINEDKPIIALARNNDGTIKASGRGTSLLLRNGLNLGQAFKDISKEMNGVEGGGHCLHPNSLVQKKDGVICEISRIKPTDLVLCREGGRLIKSQCDVIFKKKKSKIMLIKTPTYTISASADHRFFKYENFEIVEVKARELKETDFILGVKKIIFKGRAIPLTNNPFIYLKEEGIIKFRNMRLKKGLTRRQLHSKLRLETQSVGNLRDFELLHSHRINENCLFDYLKELDININAFLSKFTKRRFVCNVKILNEDIAWLMGYIQGDGHIGKKRIECKEPSKKILNQFATIISRNFNLKSVFVDMKTYEKVRVYSVDLCRFFENNFPETKLLTGSLKVPEKIMQANNKIVANYLRGLFDADGGVFDRFVHLDLVDKHLLKQCQLLLLRFGILSGLRRSKNPSKKNWRKKKSYRLDITDFDSLKLFTQKISFTKGSQKDLTLKQILEKQSVKKRNSSIFSPITYGMLREFVRKYNIDRSIFDSQIMYKRTRTKRMNYLTLKRHFIQVILKNQDSIDKKAVGIVKKFDTLCFKGNFKFYEIKKKTTRKKEMVLYDLSIPKIHNFMANGFIVHNSIAAGCKIPSEKIDEFLVVLKDKIASQLQK